MYKRQVETRAPETSTSTRRAITVTLEPEVPEEKKDDAAAKVGIIIPIMVSIFAAIGAIGWAIYKLF